MEAVFPRVEEAGGFGREDEPEMDRAAEDDRELEPGVTPNPLRPALCRDHGKQTWISTYAYVS